MYVLHEIFALLAHTHEHSIQKLIFLKVDILIVYSWIAVGTGNNTSLPEDAIFTSGDASGSKGRRYHHWKASQKQTEANLRGTGWETRKGAESRQIRWVLRFDAKGFEKRLRRGDPRRPGAPRTSQTQEVRHLVR